MKRLCFITSVLSLTLATSFAGGLGIFGSYWSTEDADESFGFGGKATIGNGDAMNLDLRGTYYFDVSDDKDAANIDMKVVPLEIGLHYTLTGNKKSRVYVGGGGSYIIVDPDIGEADNEVGWYGVGGIEFALESNISLFGEALYRNVEGTVTDDSLDQVVDQVDYDLSGFAYNIGLVMKW